ncbi:DUF11 domain-containing protein [Actinomadura oligospora]|uniref:DUF11 domain-containing protein n=1 Tax=Actinomadura oligospora TaxID=111804 RepID=UPI00047E14E9|nr:DUF11 domain-containing protein [Actinomadura oligospora]
MVQKGTGRIGARGLAALSAVPLLGVAPVVGYQVSAEADGLSAGADKTGRSAKLVVQTSGPTGRLMPGRTYSWPFAVTNNGKAKAGSAALKAPLPASLEYVSGSENCSFALTSGAGTTAAPGGGGSAVCAIGALKPGQTVVGVLSAKVSMKARPGERVTSTATVSWGSSTASKPFPATSVAETADISVVRKGPEATSPGQSIAYVTTVGNAGPAAAQNVVVSGQLPAGATLKSSSCSLSSAGGATKAVQGYTCNLGTLSVGAKKEIRTSITPRGLKRGQVLEAPVRVSTSTPEVNLANNNTTFKTRVLNGSAIAPHGPVHQRPATSGQKPRNSAVSGRRADKPVASERQNRKVSAVGRLSRLFPLLERTSSERLAPAPQIHRLPASRGSKRPTAPSGGRGRTASASRVRTRVLSGMSGQVHTVSLTNWQGNGLPVPGRTGHAVAPAGQLGQEQPTPGPGQLQPPTGQMLRLRHAVDQHSHWDIPRGLRRLHFLPHTGDESGLIVDASLGLLGGGLILMYVGRRRRVIRSSE